ncbi:MAG: hypothetical protein C4B56_00670 [Candidatus Methanophagaceae archaeon]|nr:MAG: hypothetical protein C4B56_00670 [Methanophagales archaeon]
MRPGTQIATLAVVVIIAIGTAVLPAMADTEGSSTGSFNLGNAAPSVTSITLHNADHSDPTISDMTPQTEYAVKIEISDANTLNDISEILVIIKTNGTGTGDSDSVTDKATYKWIPEGGGTWSKVGPTGTWDIDASQSSEPDDLGATAGTWWLNFVPGKVARESTSWDIYVNVTDKGSLTGDKIVWGKTMNWYGEISAEDTSYSFGDIGLGDTNKPISTPSDGNINVKTISNGNYKLSSKSGNWSKGSDWAVLDWDGTLDAGHFALKVDGSGDVSTSNYVSTSSEPITDYSNVNAPTAETGDTKEIYQWISVATSGLLPGTYSGTYYVQIANEA